MKKNYENPTLEIVNENIFCDTPVEASGFGRDLFGQGYNWLTGETE